MNESESPELPQPVGIPDFASVEEFQSYLENKSDNNGVINLEDNRSVAISEVANYFNSFVHMESEQDYPRLVKGALRGWLSQQKRIETGEIDGKLVLPVMFHANFERLVIAELDKDPDKKKHGLFEEE